MYDDVDDLDDALKDIIGLVDSLLMAKASRPDGRR